MAPLLDEGLALVAGWTTPKIMEAPNTGTTPETRHPIDDLPAPWPSGSSPIRDLIRAAIDLPRGTFSTIDLDIHNLQASGDLRWIAGAFDALIIADPEISHPTPETLFAAISELVQQPSPAHFQHFYSLVIETPVKDVIDDLLQLLRSSDLSRAIVEILARRIVLQSPDLAAVKLAIGMLGAASTNIDSDLMLELGRYEELTLYCAVALSNASPDSENLVWALAKDTCGWGRIQAVRRLRRPKNIAIKRWLLEEGHQNTVMIEYLAHFCAVEGELLTALLDPEPSEALLQGAGRILSALLCGGPAKDIDDYADGAEVALLFVEHADRLPCSDIRRLRDVRYLYDFVRYDEVAWAERESRGWTAAQRRSISTAALSFLARPAWPGLVEAGLLGDDRLIFLCAARQASHLGIDPWPHHFRRQRDLRSDEWHYLMRTDDAEHVQHVVELAMTQLDLASISSGPDTNLGLWADHKDDRALDFILQDLHRFPGIGWPLIATGLRGRLAASRWDALEAIRKWQRADWPSDAEHLLETARQIEPDAEIAERIQAVLDDRSLD